MRTIKRLKTIFILSLMVFGILLSKYTTAGYALDSGVQNNLGFRQNNSTSNVDFPNETSKPLIAYNDVIGCDPKGHIKYAYRIEIGKKVICNIGKDSIRIDGKLTNIYEFQGTANQVIVITLRGNITGKEQFYPTFVLKSPDLQEVAVVDNSNKETMVEKQVTLRAAGVYKIYIRDVDAKTGVYSIILATARNKISESDRIAFQRIRFEITRYRHDDKGAEGISGSYTPFNTDCSSSEINKYISKSITGGEAASPFVNEFSALLACGAKAAPDLVQILSTKDDHARFNATIALGDMGAVANAKVVPALIKVIRTDPNYMIRAQAIQAITLISPLTDEVLFTLQQAKSDKTIVPGSDRNPRGELIPLSEFAERSLSKDRKPEYGDASCPVKHAFSTAVGADFKQYYRLDRTLKLCVPDGNDRPTGAGGDSIIKAFCSIFQCKSK
jgi:HEAT repeats